jgi:mono/diheme cytochrome c family protein
MMRTTAFCTLLLLLAGAATHAQSQSKYGQKLAGAPAAARSRENPYANSEAARAAGKKLFERHCAECHGENGGGIQRAPSLQAVSGAATPGMLHWFIKNGDLRAGMPSWSKLPDQQLWQIVTYLRTLPGN